MPNSDDTATRTVELGLDTFGDRSSDAAGTPPVPYAQVIRDITEQGILADRVGVDFIGIGEHHRDDFAVSAPPDVVLAGIATRTERIHVGSAVTVLSSDDPVRVFERFATVDALSNGRAEVILGRGSFTESFPLFGFDLANYEALFEEKLDLFSKLLTEEPVTWQGGQLRSPLVNQEVYPKTEHGLKTWIAVGGSPESVVRAARYRIPLMLAIIGGPADRFAPFVKLYHEALVSTPPAPRRWSASTPRAMSPRPTTWLASSCSRTSRRTVTGSVQSGAGRRPPAPTSSARSSTEPCTSDPPPRPWRARSLGRCRTLAGPVRPEVRQRPDAARPADAVHRALRHHGDPAVRELLAD